MFGLISSLFFPFLINSVNWIVEDKFQIEPHANYAWGMHLMSDGQKYVSIQANRGEQLSDGGTWVVRRYDPIYHLWETDDDYQLSPGHACRPGEVESDKFGFVYVVGTCWDMRDNPHAIVRVKNPISRKWMTTFDEVNWQGRALFNNHRQVYLGINSAGTKESSFRILRSARGGVTWSSLDIPSTNGVINARVEKIRGDKFGDIWIFGSESSNHNSEMQTIFRCIGLLCPPKKYGVVSSLPERILIQDALETSRGNWLAVGIGVHESAIPNLGVIFVSEDRGQTWLRSKEVINAKEKWAGFQGIVENSRSQKLYSGLEFQGEPYFDTQIFESNDQGLTWQIKSHYSGVDGYGFVPLVMKISHLGEIFISGASVNPYREGEHHLSHGTKAVVLNYKVP